MHTLRPVLSQHDLNFTVRDKLFVVTRLNTSQQIGNPLNSGTNENGIWPPSKTLVERSARVSLRLGFWGVLSVKIIM